MMGATGEPSGYYPTDSSGLAVQNAPAQPCICAVVAPAQTGACAPLGYGGCENRGEEEYYIALPDEPLDAGSFELLRRGRGGGLFKPCSWWHRWWCHNITCRGLGGMKSCELVRAGRFVSVIICVCKGPKPRRP